MSEEINNEIIEIINEKIKEICDECISDKNQEDMDESFCFSCMIKMRREMTKEMKRKKKRFLTIRHLRTDRFGCVTAACLVNPSERKIVIGLSLCSPSDTFNKAEGRLRALRRMNNKFLNRVLYMQDENKINDMIVSAIRSAMASYPKARWIPNFLKNYRRG